LRLTDTKITPLENYHRLPRTGVYVVRAPSKT
jgi:hypothetical protein